MSRAAEEEDGCPPPPPADDVPDLVGLALSGGGIRSASFNLGVLQGLASRNALWIFDYLSTVSGGGFVGAWWTAWLSREKRSPGDVFPQAEELEPARRVATAVLLRENGEPAPPADLPDGSLIPRRRDPIQFLRLFSNYLTPRTGAFSPDTWRLIAFVARNLLFTWLVLLPLLLAAMMAGQAFFVSNSAVAPAFLCVQEDRQGASITAGSVPTGYCREVEPVDRAASLRVRARHLTAPFAVLAAAYATLALLWLAHASARRSLAFLALAAIAVLIVSFVPKSARAEVGTVERWSVLLAVVACIGLHALQSFLDFERPRNGTGTFVRATAADHRGWLSKQQTWLLRFAVCVGGLLLLAGFGHDVVRWLFSGGDSVTARLVARAGGWGGAALAIATAIYTAVKASPTTDGTVPAPPGKAGRLVVAMAPPLVLAMLALWAAWLSHALLRLATDRPPLGRLAWMTGIVAGVAILEVVFAGFESFHDPALPPRAGPFWTRCLPDPILRLLGRPPASGTDERLPWVYMFSPRGWVRIAVLGALGLVIWFLRNRSAAGVGAAFSVAWAGFVAAAVLAAAVFVTFARRTWPIALGSARPAVLLAFACLSAALCVVGSGVEVRYGDPFRSALLWIALLVGGVICMGWLVDPNLLSLHGFYKGRLSRAYLGASNTARRNEEITDSAPGDDIPLTAVWNHDAGGPYHLINTTLSLVGASDLSTSQRSAENFVLSRYHCGSARAGYRCTTEYMGGEMSLATAAAISGAAISPNMGSQTPSAALSLLLSLMNLRLGFWAPTPSGRRWSEPQARLWPFYVLRETLSNTGQIGTYCYLTDGGHFDNTGLYALVERGCRFIVVSDCGADPKLGFADIGTALRRCRIDFGTEIDLQIDEMSVRDAESRTAPAHVVWGTIRYQREHLQMLGLDPALQDGVIVWIKPSVTAKNAADVRQYHRAHSDFPQQSTGDQWYDESQFESYRRLGYESARAAFERTGLSEGTYASIGPWFQAGRPAP